MLIHTNLAQWQPHSRAYIHMYRHANRCGRTLQLSIQKQTKQIVFRIGAENCGFVVVFGCCRSLYYSRVVEKREDCWTNCEMQDVDINVAPQLQVA